MVSNSRAGEKPLGELGERLFPLSLGLLLLLALFAYGNTWVSLAAFWTGGDKSNYSHGLLLIPVCVYLIIRRWLELEDKLYAQPSVAGFLLLTLLSVIWFLAGLGSVQVIQYIALVFIVLSLFWTLLGRRGARAFAFPVLLLLAAVPVWEFLSGYLQSAAAPIVGMLLNTMGISAHVDRILIAVPAGTFEVADSCSGLRQFIVAFVVTALSAHLGALRPWVAAVYVAAGLFVAFVANVLRILIIVIAGEKTAMQHSLVTDHGWLGWVLFGIGMALFFYVSGSLLSGRASDQRLERAVPACASGGRKSRLLPAALLCAVGVLSGPLLASWYQPRPLVADRVSMDLPARIDMWEAAAAAGKDWRPEISPGDVTGKSTYADPTGKRVDVFFSLYVNQEQGREAVSDDNKVYERPAWIPLAEQYRTIDLDGDRRLTVQETVIRSTRGEERIAWLWYYIAGVHTANKGQAKLLELRNTLLRRPGSLVVVLSADAGLAPVDNNGMARFAASLLPELERQVHVAQAAFSEPEKVQDW